MNEKQHRNDDLLERLIEFSVRVLDVVESLPNSIRSLPSSLHHSLLDIRYSILMAKEMHRDTVTALLTGRAANTQQLIQHTA